MQQEQQARTAYKLWISSLVSASTVFNGERFSHLEVADNGTVKEVTKVNLIANIIDKYISENPERPYATLTLDDGSGQIRVKGFRDTMKMLLELNIGETVCVIGSVRFFNNEVYILPEIVRKLDGSWALIRRLELKQLYPEKAKIKVSSDIKSTILSLIKESDEGVDIDKLIMNTSLPVEEINSVVAQLLEAGLIYEPRPGRLRSMN
jgi:RPA family protein